MHKISGAIITYNEEKNIARCIQSMQKVCDEIVVLDSFSTDQTPSICGQFELRFYQKEFLGYGFQKREVSQHCRYDYILSLDADECLSNELIEEISKLKNKDMADVYFIPRLTNYCGHWVKHCGWYPDKKIRLWNTQKAEWTEDNIHEIVRTTSSEAVSAHLKSNILHYSFNTAEDHFEKIKKYSDIQAENMFRANKNYPWFYQDLAAVIKFIELYFYKFGFLDGKIGFLISYRTAIQQYLKYAKLRQMRTRISKM